MGLFFIGVFIVGSAVGISAITVGFKIHKVLMFFDLSDWNFSYEFRSEFLLNSNQFSIGDVFLWVFYLLGAIPAIIFWIGLLGVRSLCSLELFKLKPVDVNPVSVKQDSTTDSTLSLPEAKECSKEDLLRRTSHLR